MTMHMFRNGRRIALLSGTEVIASRPGPRDRTADVWRSQISVAGSADTVSTWVVCAAV
jgi:hypothetical protein